MPDLLEMPLNDEWLARLQAGGYRLTAPLRAVIQVMGSSQRARSPIEIYDLGRQVYPRLGLVTVYRALEKLEELRLVQRVHQPGGCHMYLRASQGHEHLLLCVACGQAEYFSGDDLTALFDRISSKSGFKIQEHWLQLFGLCTACQAK